MSDQPPEVVKRAQEIVTQRFPILEPLLDAHDAGVSLPQKYQPASLIGECCKNTPIDIGTPMSNNDADALADEMIKMFQCISKCAKARDLIAQAVVDPDLTPDQRGLAKAQLDAMKQVAGGSFDFALTLENLLSFKTQNFKAAEWIAISVVGALVLGVLFAVFKKKRRQNDDADLLKMMAMAQARAARPFTDGELLEAALRR